VKFLLPFRTYEPDAMHTAVLISAAERLATCTIGTLLAEFDGNPEFRAELTPTFWHHVARAALEVLRQPLEDGAVTIARAAGTMTFPARFTLIASMNPCPCGFRGDKASDCRCDDTAVQRYLAKLSGPLLDRIDLHVGVSHVPFDELVGRGPAETSARIRARVEAARERQAARSRDGTASTNAAIAAADVRRLCPLDADTPALLARVARTIADLAGTHRIAREHVGEALLYRGVERTRSSCR
jgi:magnesium chelatase family protein